MTLREVLHAHIPYLHAEATVRDAVDKMDVYQFPALVVIDEDHRPIAVVTEGDLARAASSRDSFVSLGNEPVLAHATADPQTAEGGMDIGDALHQMLMSGLTILPVVADGRLEGMVLRVDLMQALLADAS